MAKTKNKKSKERISIFQVALCAIIGVLCAAAMFILPLTYLHPIVKTCDGVEILATAIKLNCLEDGRIQIQDTNNDSMYVNLSVSPRTVHGNELVYVGVYALAISEDGSRPFFPVCTYRDYLHGEFEILPPNGDLIEIDLDYNQDVVVVCSHDDGTRPVFKVEITIPIKVFP